ncbi:MAG TPA: hypothetical protein ENL09_02590, partial [Bacteroidetes bacterium]|nr:hypothetical protein [Bacteroidota bacterium]
MYDDYNTLIRQVVIDATNKLNEIFKEDDLYFINNWKHIVKRSRERSLDVSLIRELLDCFIDHNLDKFIGLAKLPYQQRPFRIEIRSPDLIIMFSRMDDYKWKINTLLDPKIHSK